MAKSHFSTKKRQKELTRKLKQEEKRQRKQNKSKTDFQGDPDQSQDDIEYPQV